MYRTSIFFKSEVILRRQGKSRQHDKWLKSLGQRIEGLIHKKGYKSVYDFWIQKGEDKFTRSTLNYIVAGKTDPKATSLHAIAKQLGVSTKELFDFE